MAEQLSGETADAEPVGEREEAQAQMPWPVSIIHTVPLVVRAATAAEAQSKAIDTARQTWRRRGRAAGPDRLSPLMRHRGGPGPGAEG